MELWKWMYALIWLAFLEFVLVLVPVGYLVALVDAHAVVGIAVLAVAHRNARALKATAAPDRVKRIARAAAGSADAQVVLGLLLWANLVGNVTFLGGAVFTVVLLIHLVLAVAVITQASSAATGYDMWEEKEFLPAGDVKVP